MLLNRLNATRGLFRPARVVRPGMALARGPQMQPMPMGRRFYSAELDPKTYHQLSDEALEDMLVSYEDLAEFVPEIDVELAQGVLTLILPPNGTYVINKQPPNKQIWLSSPLSGPKRYDYVDGKWTYLRDNSTLGQLLKDETKLVTEQKGVQELELNLD